MRIIVITVLLFSFKMATSQELYVYTEPASNMAAKNIGLRLTNILMRDKVAKKNRFFITPELMWGISKKIMVHATVLAGNGSNDLLLNGGSVYLKYRFLSNDEVHRHFRMAAFGKYSWNNSDIHDYAIQLNNQNTGYEIGLIATQLHHKVALSASASFLHVTDNINNKFAFGNKLRNAVGYTVSVGKLMLPKEYTNYQQTNLNLMLELLGQSNLYNGYSNLDVAPAVQFIFNSRMRIDLGYRFPVVTKLHRYNDRGTLLRFEYNFFNAY